MPHASRPAAARLSLGVGRQQKQIFGLSRLRRTGKSGCRPGILASRQLQPHALPRAFCSGQRRARPALASAGASGCAAPCARLPPRKDPPGWRAASGSPSLQADGTLSAGAGRKLSRSCPVLVCALCWLAGRRQHSLSSNRSFKPTVQPLRGCPAA